MNAATVLLRLEALQSDEEKQKITRYFKAGEGEYGHGDQFIGVKMGLVFEVAKEFQELPGPELEALLESPVHEARACAMSMMDKQGRGKKTTDARRRELYDLYLRRHDRINNWDLVDLGAPFVIGRYLEDKPRDLLDRLALSKNLWERRTAIVATAYYLRSKRVDDTFRIAEALVRDPEDLIHKAVGGWVRQAGLFDRPRLLAFLDRHPEMPRVMLRYATEHLEPEVRAKYVGKK